ncbi:poly-gamma-glutamate synthesis protein (capsule biosynthesis protein) [Evansella vedderi]|uniref:Poly-gamma-glutamate synthesis protein (Capsule biosynthesis protein) n=1 Tax=Evansella vedderi TaxID=38282 RepID=A0ABT9ZUQ2_9BACI|nr:CapA family protein [Evansella vedderi]MDQ0254441.1 poly-gamma-glutamate synthesis protein (capsule biosynthesis protein) [Evansella vedderi]
MESYNFKEKMQQMIKRHKKKATFHSIIAFIVLSIPWFSYHWFVVPPIPEVSRGDDVSLRISMVGDIMMGRHVEDAAVRRGEDTSRVFRYVEPYFHSADYVTGNFESPIIDRDLVDDDKLEAAELDKHIHLYAPTGSAEAIQDAGFTTINLANNHLMDYGELGLEQTLAHFANVDVDVVGVGESLEDISDLVVHTVNDGFTIATIGLTDVHVYGFSAELYGTGGVFTLSPHQYVPVIREAKENADLVIVHVHWGEEYSPRYNARQADHAQLLADAGADIIVGHHAHVLNPVEIIDETIVLYGLGNFVFDQGWSRTKESTIAELNVYEDGRKELSFIPIQIIDSQPRETRGLLRGYQNFRIFHTLRKNLDSELWRVENNRLIIDLDATNALKGVDWK